MRILLVLACVSGCVVGDESASRGGDLISAIRPERPIPNNGLLFDAELARRLPIGALGTRAADGTIESAHDVFAGPGGQALAKYVATCALPADSVLSAGGAKYEGYYGLAPEWASGECGETCQHWVSACLLAHANHLGEPVQISPRADHPSFAWEAKVLEAHTFQDAAFYGNVFRGELFACTGTGLMDLGNTDAYLHGRICGISGNCGLENFGFCFSITPELELGDAVCDRTPAAGGHYADCHHKLAEGYPRTSPVIHEVITVYVAP